MKRTLDKKVTGSLFKGSTWDEFLNHIRDYFIPRFNKPILIVPKTDVLFNLGEIRFGDENLDELFEYVEREPKENYNTFISIIEGGKRYKTKIPSDIIDELAFRLQQ